MTARACALLAGMAVLLASGCGEGGPLGNSAFDRTTITFALSVHQDEARAISDLVGRFERATKGGVSVELLTRFRNRPRAVTLASVRSADMAEAIKKGRPRIALFAQDNVDLAELVIGGLVQDVSDVEVDPAVVDSMRPPKFDGKQMFLPFRPNVRLAYANRSHFEEADLKVPRNLEEFRTAARALKSRNAGPAATLSLSKEDGGAPTSVTVSELVLAFGGEPAALNDTGSKRAFEFLQSLAREGLLTRESFFAKHDTEIEYLEEGRSWLAENWSVTSAKLAGAGRLDDFVVYAGWQGRHVIGGDVLGIPAYVTGKERQAAADLARFLMSREAQAFLVDRNAWPAIRNDAYPATDGRDDTLRAVEEALQTGWYRPIERYWADVTKAMNQAVERIVRQSEPVEVVLDELHAWVKGRNLDYPY